MELDFGFLINNAVGLVLKHTKVGKKRMTVPNWSIPLVNLVLTTGAGLLQGEDLGVAASRGVMNTLMATGLHSAVKNPIKVATGRSI